jgi:hypothetical protein
MTSPRHLSWENFRGTVLLPGEQRVHRIIDRPLVEIFGDGVANRIGMWIEVPSETVVPADVSRLAAIRTELIKKDGRVHLEVSTCARSLQKQFYHFATAVAERIAVEAQPAVDAVQLELRCFVDLLEQKPVLGIERQIGLVGELLVLQHLITEGGIDLLDAWIAPTPEPHDFRIGNSELEVKTTVAPRRIHTIHGGEQLVPSAGCSLHLISVLLGPLGTGTGFSLKSLVDALSGCFSSDLGRQNRFAELLTASGYRDLDGQHYMRQFALRRSLAIVAINARFPAITRPVIQKVLGAEAQRIDQVQYEVNVEGLEHESGSLEFSRVLGHVGVGR